MSVSPLDRRMLLLAARAGWRAAGRVEPNPMVGCVIGSVGGVVLGVGHHRVFGGPHAEVEAIADCQRRGHSTHGATAWVTLEPCNHFGKTGPCTEALLRAGVARVVFARRDPNPPASGGAERLRGLGVEVVEAGGMAFVERLSEAFVKRVKTGLPWVIAKWAQTLDGKVATRSGDSKWISNPSSRLMVHRLRARVDAVLTGVGTVRVDDPMLTARGVAVRRLARRCIVDPRLETPANAAMLRTASDAPITFFTGATAARGERAESLRAAGCEVVALPLVSDGLDLLAALRHLASAHAASNVLTECGPGLMGRLFRSGLVDEALVFTAPKLLGDQAALAAATIGEASSIAHAVPLTLRRVRVVGGDVVGVYGR